MAKELVIYTDGGSRGNPGPGSGAFVLRDGTGNVVGGKGVFLSNTTNNFAEYTGLYEGLAEAKEIGAESVKIFSDSELMVRQINGEYRVKSDNLKGIYARCKELLSGFSQWHIKHVMREENTEADTLANRAMDARHEVELELKSGLRAARGKRVRLGVLISGGGTTMVNIQNQIDSGNLNAEIGVVISSRSKAKGVARARKIGVDLEIIRKKDYPDIDDFSSKIADVLDSHEVDLVVQTGWLCLWKIPDKYAGRVMNIHPALLPSFGGQGMWGHHVHEAVLKSGCKLSGCTVHFCTDEYDEGAIIVQRSCPVLYDDDADSLAARVFDEECKAYPEAIRLFSAGRIEITDGQVKVKPAAGG